MVVVGEKSQKASLGDGWMGVLGRKEMATEYESGSAGSRHPDFMQYP